MSNIFCIGRNYAEHARELGNAVPEKPIVFLKPSGALMESPKTLELPKDVGSIHHEAEIVLKMGSIGEIAAWAIGIDLTAREVQTKAKANGHPWIFAKGLKGFAPVGNWVSFSGDPGSASWNLELRVNGELRQKGSTSEMIWQIPSLLKFLDGHFGLQKGDLIFTGTPAGVGPVKTGDQIQALASSKPGTQDQSSLRFKVI